eukprot:m.103980 g.103980  ORF g.103980 m.103980 type:complete len:169 (+) comp15610_c0_seq4:78-584(+)
MAVEVERFRTLVAAALDIATQEFQRLVADCVRPAEVKGLLLQLDVHGAGCITVSAFRSSRVNDGWLAVEELGVVETDDSPELTATTAAVEQAAREAATSPATGVTTVSLTPGAFELTAAVAQQWLIHKVWPRVAALAPTAAELDFAVVASEGPLALDLATGQSVPCPG